jgi:mannose-6-phosphate isomerase-like protein (cupin superfamily)
MDSTEMTACLANGSVTYLGRDDSIGRVQWIAHPKFKGVYLKHLVKGADTEGKLSCHVVRIDPNAVLEDHCHEGQWELHEVVEGEGIFRLDGKETPYYPGRMGVIPNGTSHQVTAGKTGLVLLAKFFPALL